MGDETAITLALDVDAEADAEEIDALTRSLRRELAELDFAEVRSLEAREAPAGAKSGGAVAIGTLVVTLAQSAGGIAAITGIVQAWLSRGRGRAVELEIDGNRIKVTGASTEAEQRLVDEWIRRNAGRGGGR